MITLETLKENRIAIIEMLNEKLGSENVAEGMQIIAKMVGFRGYDKFDVMTFCEVAISDSGIEDRIIMANGAKAQRWLEQKAIEQSRELKKHI